MKTIYYLKNLWFRWKCRGLYVDLDPADTSVTLSKKLFIQMGVMKQKEAKVMMFRAANSAAGDVYAFELNPPVPEENKETPMAEVMINTKYKTFGFETLVPTVASMLYSWGLPNKPVRAKVIPQKLDNNRTIWLILPPKR